MSNQQSDRTTNSEVTQDFVTFLSELKQEEGSNVKIQQDEKETMKENQEEQQQQREKSTTQFEKQNSILHKKPSFFPEDAEECILSKKNQRSMVTPVDPKRKLFYEFYKRQEANNWVRNYVLTPGRFAFLG